MKLKLFFIAIIGFFSVLKAQEVPENNTYTYLDLTEEFDLLVDYTLVNPECTNKKENHYSVIIGTTVVDDYLERISVLVPCLENEFIAGDLISIKPIKVPKKNIVYQYRTFQDKEGNDVTQLFASEFRAIWGTVKEVL